MRTNKNTYKLYLDIIKLFSCFIVFFSHFKMAFFSGKYSDILLFGIKIPNIFVDGNFAVCCFLVVSCFIYFNKGISYSDEEYFLLMKKDIFSRYVRLFIPAAITNLIIFIFIKLGLFFNSSLPISNPDVKNWFNLGNYALVKVLYSTVTLCFFGGINPPLWCYHLLFLQPLLILLCIPLFKVIEKKVSILICLFLSLLLLLKQNYWAVIPLIFLLSELKERKYITFILFVIGLIGKIIMRTFNITTCIAPNMLIAVSLVFLLDILNIECRIKSNIIAKLNKISFSVYLLHIIFICSVGFYIYTNVTENLIICFIGTFISLVLCAIPFHIFIEGRLTSFILRILKIK